MNGHPKGLLSSPNGDSIVLRSIRILEKINLPYTLIGNRTIYEPLGFPIVDDLHPGEGPLAGLEAALLEARRRSLSGVLLLACDMPFFQESLLRRLLDHPPATIVVPVRDGHFEPLLARYDLCILKDVQARLARGDRAIQSLLQEQQAAPLSLSLDEEKQLEDWDTPDDLPSLRLSLTQESNLYVNRSQFNRISNSITPTHRPAHGRILAHIVVRNHPWATHSRTET